MAMEVQAKYIGENSNGSYSVNVKTAHPTGNLGDGGVIRTFDTKEEAKAYAALVNETGTDSYSKKVDLPDIPTIHQGDSFVSRNAETAENNDDISWLRIGFGLLTDEQINTINETGRLPKNAKIVKNGNGEYVLANNFFNITTGTRTVPEGFEVRKNVLGFSVVVPKDSEGLLIRDKK